MYNTVDSEGWHSQGLQLDHFALFLLSQDCKEVSHVLYDYFLLSFQVIAFLMLLSFGVPCHCRGRFFLYLFFSSGGLKFLQR